jgi:hypothetical protein
MKSEARKALEYQHNIVQMTSQVYTQKVSFNNVNSKSKKKIRKREFERESWIEKEMENLKLSAEIKSYVKCWSKMRSGKIEMTF